jgi:hypothetical protein
MHPGVIERGCQARLRMILYRLQPKIRLTVGRLQQQVGGRVITDGAQIGLVGGQV